jgi:hypothetical protein
MERVQTSVDRELLDAVRERAVEEGRGEVEVVEEALRRYLLEHGGEGITERLDEVYGEEEGSGSLSGLDPVVAALQERSLPKDAW